MRQMVLDLWTVFEVVIELFGVIGLCAMEKKWPGITFWLKEK
jgi:hypothetical protein